ncbi:MAG: RNA polymerase sigma factor [Candidatus Moranbacteria bacterium]|nr:RNA polymerase sigma factor [Candidatus Moranbacteria bacterium]MDD3965212.1 RNA polymerase sigma factor [Candidatus Moranbacteria bacterium]
MIKRKSQNKSKEEKTDEELVRFVLNGDKKYFGEIVLRYEKKLLVYLRYLIGKNDEIADLLQNIFSKAFAHLEDFDADRKLSPWLYRIAHNEAMNYLRKQSYLHLIDQESLVDTQDRLKMVDDSGTPFETLMRDEARIAVRQALNMLSEKDRRLLKLRYYLEKSYAEMSHVLAVPENTIASRLSRSKKKLLDILEKKKLSP